MTFVHEDAEFEDLLRIVAGARRLSLGLVEKDYWVTHTLWALHAQGFDVWFKGGTSLSKGFGLIERFSEDLDHGPEVKLVAWWEAVGDLDVVDHLPAPEQPDAGVDDDALEVFSWHRRRLLLHPRDLRANGSNVIECYMSASGSSARPAGNPQWPVIITEWALDSYLNLRHANVFTDQDYRGVLRPYVELLKDGIPSPHAKFSNTKFWGRPSRGTPSCTTATR